MKEVPPSFKECEAFLQNASPPCFFLDRKGRILSVNAAFEHLFQHSSDSLCGRAIEEFISPSDSFLRRMKQRKEVDSREETVVILDLPGGKKVPVSICLQRLRTGARKTNFILWIQDVSELRELRTRLEHSEKLSAMAIVAGKVAHEIRTPLNSIFLNNDLLQEKVEKMRGAQGRKLRRYIGILQEEVERLNEVVRSYLSLARLVGSDRQSTDLSLFLTEFISDVREEYSGFQITVATSFRASGGKLPLNRRQFRRVMLNLFANSRDAIKRGGVITVSTEDTRGGMRITISDNGPGSAKFENGTCHLRDLENRDAIFDLEILLERFLLEQMLRCPSLPI